MEAEALHRKAVNTEVAAASMWKLCGACIGSYSVYVNTVRSFCIQAATSAWEALHIELRSFYM